MRLECEVKGSVTTLVVGAGAAGGNGVVRLAERLVHSGMNDLGGHLLWVSNSFSSGTSRCSGSDKQTYYKLGTSPTSANAAVDWAKTLTQGGACHEDLALLEAIGSLREFYHLVDLGVPFPHDEFGALVGYQTDNDPHQSATSAGPLTSRLMTEALERQARRLLVPMVSGLELIDIQRRDGAWISVFVDLDAAQRGQAKLAVFLSRFLVLATGGPGMLFRTTVYPEGIFSGHGVLFRRGASGVNLSEWQFGLASVQPRWNVSGSYLQAIPRMFSVDPEGGDAQDFLNAYVGETNRQASLIFLKGYQWPFDADHLPDGSSLIDLAVYREQLSGRRVFLDFTRNPQGREGRFDVKRLSSEPRDYLTRRGATSNRPIDRLSAINPPAIDLYRGRGVALSSQSLQIALCSQHNNGGIQVDLNWQSELENVYVVGELAGTHGVRRPGGSALNAGQVGAHRAADDIFEKLRQSGSEVTAPNVDCDPLAGAYGGKLQGSFDGEKVISRIRSTMDRAAGVIRNESSVRDALKELSGLYREIDRGGFKAGDGREALTAFQAENLLLTAIGYLHNIWTYIRCGGGSRGSSLIASDDGNEIHDRLIDDHGRRWKYLPENRRLRDCVFVTRYRADEEFLFETNCLPVRRFTYQTVPFEQVYLKYSKSLKP